MKHKNKFPELPPGHSEPPQEHNDIIQWYPTDGSQNCHLPPENSNAVELTSVHALENDANYLEGNAPGNDDGSAMTLTQPM